VEITQAYPHSLRGRIAADPDSQQNQGATAPALEERS